MTGPSLREAGAGTGRGFGATVGRKREGSRRLKTLHEIEYAPPAEREALRVDDSPLTVAYNDLRLRAEGLAKQVNAVRAVVGEHRDDVPVHGAMCFVDGELPVLRTLTFQDWPLLYPKAMAKRLDATGPLDAATIRDLARSLAHHFPPA